eukprot:SAG31_NODE_1855_length_7064_cov_49.836324_8_plen_129_part_00
MQPHASPLIAPWPDPFAARSQVRSRDVERIFSARVPWLVMGTAPVAFCLRHLKRTVVADNRLQALHRRGVLCQVQRRALADILLYVEEKRPCMKCKKYKYICFKHDTKSRPPMDGYMDNMASAAESTV